MKNKLSNNSFRQKKSNRGFSLVEVLISILIMTFGLLGISGLMMKGIDNSTGSELALRATQSANEIIDAMRANSTNIKSNPSLYTTSYNTSLSSLSGTSVDQVERKGWLTALRQLPGGDGEIRVDTDPLVTNGFIVNVRFANCIGTLTKADQDKCASSANNNEKRTLQFKFKL